MTDVAVNDVVLAMHRASSPEELAERLLQAVRERYQPAACVVVVRDGEHISPLRWFGIDQGAERHSIRLDGSVAERLRSGVPLHVADLRGDVIRDLGGRSAIPCLGRHELQAVIIVDAGDADVAVRSFLCAVAPHVGLAVESLGYLPTEREEQSTASDADRALALTREFGMTATLHTLAWRVLSAALGADGGMRGVLYMYDPQMDELRLAAATGLLDKAREHRINRKGAASQQVSPGQGPAGDVLLTGLPRVVSDEQLSASSEWWPDTTLPQSVAFLPLQAQGEVIAVLGLCGGAASTSLDSAPEVLAEVLDRGAIALKRARSLEPVLVDAETGLYEGQFVEALLGDAIRRSDESDARVTVVTLRVGESSTHRGADAGAPPILEIADALAAAAEQDLDVVGHLGHGRFVAILEDTGADVAHTLVENFLESVGSHRTEVAVHAAAVVERRVGESADSVWERAHDMLMRIYDEGPGLRIGVATQVRERVMREHVPSFVTPVAPAHR